jgi:hypothetical protein
VPLDRLLPDADVITRHERRVAAPPELAFAAALGVPFAPDRIATTLVRVRGLPRGGSIEGALLGLGFSELERSPSHIVLGASGTPWRRHGRLAGWDRSGPGRVQMAVELAAEAAGSGRSVLRTETRVFAADAAARRAFGRYWLAVGPFSSLVRRRWLAASARVAEG